jgi:hypothetical protein
MHAIEPTCLDEISETWLTYVLRSRGVLEHARVRALRVERLGTQGATSDTARLSPEYDVAEARAPRSLIVKLASRDPQTRALMIALGTYERELRFYSEIAPEAGPAIPHCHHAVSWPETGAFVLLLDDVYGTPGVPHLSALEAAVVELARLHARYWNSPRLRELGWLEHDASRLELFRKSLIGAVAKVRLRLGHCVPRDFAEAAALCGEHFATLIAARDQDPRTLIHGDLHPGQLICGAQGPVFLDWQTVWVGTPGKDLARLISMSLPPMLRLSHERRLVAAYQTELQQRGVTGFDFETCMRDYRMGLLHSVMMNVFAAAELDVEGLCANQPEGEVSVFDRLFGRVDRALRDHDVVRSLRAELGLLSRAA